VSLWHPSAGLGSNGLANISEKLAAQLPQGLLNLLREIGEISAARGENVFLVGGVVRDVILERSNLDMDLVTEGKAISFARQLSKIKDWDIKTHPRFGTAKLTHEDFSLDLVTARFETYSRPGALPTVERGTIQDDLARRDFTINAMAIHLNPDLFGELLDPHEGQNDLQHKLVRILHTGSFSDDPTRILRALRYEQRLDFKLEPDTEKLVRKHLDNLDTVTGERLWSELELILQEEYPEKALKRADELGVLQQLYPKLKGDKWLAEKFAQARDLHDKSLSLASIYLSLLCYRLNDEEIESCITRFKMPGWAIRTLKDTIQIKKSIPQLDKAVLNPSDIYFELQHRAPETIMSTSVASHSLVIQQRLQLYLNELRYVKPALSGEYLKNMGTPKGKKVGQILLALHAARLDSKVSNLEEEKTLARELLHTIT